MPATAAIGPTGVLTGSARLNLEADRRTRRQAREDEIARQERALARRRRALDAQIEALRADLTTAEEDVQAGIAQTRSVDQREAEAQLRAAETRNSARGGSP